MVTVSFPSCNCFTRVIICAFKGLSATEAVSDVFEYVQASVSFISSSVSFTMILGTFCICVANFRSFSNLAASDIISASEMEIASAVSFRCSNSDSASAFACFVISSTTLSTIFGDSTRESIVCSSDSCKNFTADSNSEISELDCEFSMTIGVSACWERFSLSPSSRISCDNSSFASLSSKSTDSNRLLSKSMSKSFCCKLLSVPRDSSIIFSLSAVSLTVLMSSFIFKLLSSFSVILSLLGMLILASLISLSLFVKQLAITTLSSVFISFSEEFSLSDIRVISKSPSKVFSVDFSAFRFSFELSCNKEISITFDCTSFKLASVDSSTTDFTFSSIIGVTLSSIDSSDSTDIFTVSSSSLESDIASDVFLSTSSISSISNLLIFSVMLLELSHEIGAECNSSHLLDAVSSISDSSDIEGNCLTDSSCSTGVNVSSVCPRTSSCVQTFVSSESLIESFCIIVNWQLHSFLQYLDDLCFFSIDCIHIILSIGSCSSSFNLLYKSCFLRIIINFNFYRNVFVYTETSLSSQSSTSFVHSFASSKIGQLSFTFPVFGISFSLKVVELSCFSVSATVDILNSTSVLSLFLSVLSVNSIVDTVDFDYQLFCQRFHPLSSQQHFSLWQFPVQYHHLTSISIFSETLCSVIIDDSVCVLLSQARSDIPCCSSWMLSVHFSDTILDSALEISILSVLVIQTVLEVGLGIVELCCVTGFKLSNCKVGSTFDSVIICERAAISLSKVESPICSPDCTPMISLISIMLRASVSYVSVSLSTPYGA
ncbi:hypothetical protein ALC56_03580 [Trachymyrmex septentrionalis]|uniref:Uncharacterized protein n=1 Tax=Trachymyrmex septentrionalis TaxID=34720 RepID=A0A195FNM3_9HYME|nr:hypothetical protein ALC56_03580 [Trachymyrmex septentrionalis]